MILSKWADPWRKSQHHQEKAKIIKEKGSSGNTGLWDTIPVQSSW